MLKSQNNNNSEYIKSSIRNLGNPNCTFGTKRVRDFIPFLAKNS